MQIYIKMDIKSIEWDKSNREEGQDWSQFSLYSNDNDNDNDNNV